MACNVHHITPGRSDKNLGKAINDIIKLLPENDWVCIRDIDTYPTYHEKYFDVCESIANQGKFDLVGCLTNRLGLPWQCVTGMYDESDIRVHRSKGIELYQKNKDAVLQVNKNIAGLFFLFPKSTWVKVGGFKEGGIRIDGKYIDNQFSRSVQRLGLKTGIASGIYLFHWYRFDKEKTNTEHLF